MPNSAERYTPLDPAALDVLRGPSPKTLAQYIGHQDIQVACGLSGYAGTLTKVTKLYAHILQTRLAAGVRKFPLDRSTFVVHWTPEEKQCGYAVRRDRTDHSPYGTYRAVCISCLATGGTWLVGSGSAQSSTDQANAHVANAHDRLPTETAAWDTTRGTRLTAPGIWETFTERADCPGYTIQRRAGRTVTYWVRQNNDPRNAQQYHHLAAALTWRGALLGALVHASTGELGTERYPAPWEAHGIELMAQEYIERTGLTPAKLNEHGHWDVSLQLPESPDRGLWGYDRSGTLADALVHAATQFVEDQELDPTMARISDHNALHCAEPTTQLPPAVM